MLPWKEARMMRLTDGWKKKKADSQQIKGKKEMTWKRLCQRK